MKLCQQPNCMNTVFGGGYCKNHQYLRQDKKPTKSPYQKAVEKKKAQNQKANVKSKIRGLVNTEQNKLVANAAAKYFEDKEQWFQDRRKEMTGFCQCGCNNPSSKNDDKHFRSSCCHVMAKKHFKSIALHPENCIELAFFGGCHTTLDDMGYAHCKNTKPILWAIVVRKFKILYPLIEPKEHKFIPNVLLLELEQDA